MSDPAPPGGPPTADAAPATGAKSAPATGDAKNPGFGGKGVADVKFDLQKLQRADQLVWEELARAAKERAEAIKTIKKLEQSVDVLCARVSFLERHVKWNGWQCYSCSRLFPEPCGGD